MFSDIYQHYRPEEEPFIDQVYGWLEQVNSSYAPYLSQFLTPRQVTILRQVIAGQDEVRIALDGGYPNCERQRALLFPPYYQVQEGDLDLAFLKVKYPIKFAELTHGQILGSLIGSGIERDRLGDIITDGQEWHVIVDETMALYLWQTIDKIDKVGVRLESIPRSELLVPIEEWEDQTVISSSLRLDSLISKVYNISRQRAKEAVQAGLVKVNFLEMDRVDVLVGLEDIVSMRRFGRFRIRSIDGFTKKENYRLTVQLLKVKK